MALSAIGRREDHRPRRMPRVRDEHLGAVEDVLVAATLGCRLDPRGVGAGVGLGESERAQDRRVDQRRKPLSFLLVGAGEQDRRRAERVGHDGDGHARATPRELLADQHPFECRQAEPADLLREMHVHEPELVRLRDDVRRVRPVLVVLGRLRPNLVLGELAGESAKLALLRRRRKRHAVGELGLHRRHAYALLLD